MILDTNIVADIIDKILTERIMVFRRSDKLTIINHIGKVGTLTFVENIGLIGMSSVSKSVQTLILELVLIQQNDSKLLDDIVLYLFYKACKEGYVDIIDAFFPRDTLKKDMALIIACKYHQLTIANAMLSPVRNNISKAFRASCRYGFDKMIDICISRGYDNRSMNLKDAFKEACKGNQVKTMTKIINNEKSPRKFLLSNRRGISQYFVDRCLIEICAHGHVEAFYKLKEICNNLEINFNCIFSACAAARRNKQNHMLEHIQK